ncbi:MAG: MFS transporter, partial [Candidatus Sumerlaeia bacterium]|nr:MFS transporter [Candidatus Sumerlaeia bacterium]
AFIVALFLGVISVMLQQTLIQEGKKSNRAEINPVKMFPLMSPELKRLLISDILIRFCEQMPYAFVVIWCVTLNKISAVQFGILTAIEMATAVIIYIPVAYLADKTTKKPFVIATFVFFTLFPLMLFLAKSFWHFVLVFILRGLKEFGEPTRKALILDLCPVEKQAGMFGFYYLIRDIVVSMSALGGAFLWNISPLFNFLTAFAFGVAGSIFFAIYGSDLKSFKRF